jgi:hypothetical protein
MNGFRHIATGTGLWLALLSTAPGQTESAQFFFGTNAYPADLLDRPRLDSEAEHPELFRPPNVGDVFVYRVLLGNTLAREIAGTVVSASILECADGPEIALHPGDLRLDLLRALYLTDVLHRTPQILDAEPPSEPFLPPTFEIQEPPFRE